MTDTPDEALVERVALALKAFDHGDKTWPVNEAERMSFYEGAARAAIAALATLPAAEPAGLDGDLVYALRSALRFAASRSAITAAQETAILAALPKAAEQGGDVVGDHAALIACRRNVYRLQQGGERLCVALRKIASGDGGAVKIAQSALNNKAADPDFTALAARDEELERLREILRQAMNALACSDKNDPLEPIADNGMTVWDGMRSEYERLRALLAPATGEAGK